MLKISKRVWLFAIVAIGFILISNYDTFELPDNLINALALISFVVSFIGGFLFFTSVISLILIVVRLIKRERIGQVIVWSLFVGILFFVDLVITREVFLDISRDRILSRTQPLIVAIEQCWLDTGSYPDNLDHLIPQYLTQLPKPGSRDWDNFRYKNLECTYRLEFSQWISGRTYRNVIYTPTGALMASEHASSEVYETGLKNWKYVYY